MDQGKLPVPFNSIQAFPSAFFIDKDGKIKIATEGLIPGGQMKQLVAAEKW